MPWLAPLFFRAFFFRAFFAMLCLLVLVTIRPRVNAADAVCGLHVGREPTRTMLVPAVPFRARWGARADGQGFGTMMG